MSRVITFSRFFPTTHKRKGEPTHFVEQIYNSLGFKIDNVPANLPVNDFFILDGESKKHHTIRSGNHWRVGDKFSPRVWSGKPYCSPMITIAPDIEIKKISSFECKKDGTFYLDGKQIDVTSCDLPENDGLSTDDFLEWFKVGKEFTGQVIYWNDKIEY